MINHGRTLLLNRKGAGRPPLTDFLEEYVPTDFSALSLPSGLQVVHDRLVPPGADDPFANLLMHAYMQLLHSTDLEDDLLALDPRITYDLARTAVESRAQTTYYSSVAGTTLIFSGQVSASMKTPQLSMEWTLEAVTANRVKAVRVPTGATLYTDVTVTDNTTSPIALPDQRDYTACAGNLPGALPVGAQWDIRTFVVPHVDASEILAGLDAMGDEALLALFPSREPYLTYKRLWQEHVYAEYRLGGVLLAFIYRAEEVRTGG